MVKDVPKQMLTYKTDFETLHRPCSNSKLFFLGMFLRQSNFHEMLLLMPAEGWMAGKSPGQLHRWHIMSHQLTDSTKWWWLQASNSCTNSNSSSIHTTTTTVMTITAIIIECSDSSSVFKWKYWTWIMPKWLLVTSTSRGYDHHNHYHWTFGLKFCIKVKCEDE